MSAHDISVTGRFGPYGGRYVPETLMHALEELAAVYDAARADPRFGSELDDLLRNYVGRPTPITAVPRLSAQVGAKVILDTFNTTNSRWVYISNPVSSNIF